MPVAALSIDRLIIQLGNDDAGQRDLAQKQLLHIGSTAVPALSKAARDNDDPEVRTRASQVIAELKEHADEDASLLTLHLTNSPAKQVLIAIADQSRAQITSFGTGRVFGVDNRLVTVDADQKPFWDVMTDVCTQLNVCPSSGLVQGQMKLMPAVGRNWMLSPHQTVGPFWIGITGVNRTRAIDLMGPPATDDQFIVRLMVVPEPKLAVAQISELQLTQARDDAGNSLKPAISAQDNSARNLIHSLVPGVSPVIETHLSYPEKPGSKIALLSGEVQVVVGEEVEQFVLDDVLGTPKTVASLQGCTVDATVVKQASPGTFLISLLCTRSGMSDSQWAAVTNRMNDVTLEDAQGNPLSELSHSSASAGFSNTFRATFFFSSNAVFGMALPQNPGAAGKVPAITKAGEPKRLTWNVATALKTLKVPISFKDLPMP